MPPRWVCFAIVAFWLTTCYWLFHNEVWPALRTGEPPPYSIDLVDEAQHDQLQVRWNLRQSGKPTLTATTTVKYREADDTFSLEAEYKPKSLPSGERPEGVLRLLKTMSSAYRVGRRGELREMLVAVNLDPHVECKLQGVVQGGRFVTTASLTTPLGSRDLDLPDVEVSFRGSVLQPLHPVNRIEGLRPGQSWRMPVLDPFAATFGGEALTFLDARVLPDLQPLTLDNRTFRCLKIEYRGSDREGATWVDEKTGLVLRQDARMGEHLWTMERQTSLPSDR